jgi:hypothetical protein
MELFHIIIEVLKSTLTITCLVMVMLLLIEFVNVSSSGHLMDKLRHKPFIQIMLAALLGLIPGCIGGFTVVSLFTHNLISFGALLAGMISTFGDEAFFLFAYSPKWTLILAGILLLLAIIVGPIVHFIFRKKNVVIENHNFEVHHDETDHHHSGVKLSWGNFRNLTFSRAILIFGLTMYLIFQLSGTFSHNHALMPELKHQNPTSESVESSTVNSERQGEIFSINNESRHDAETVENNHDHQNEEHAFHWENIVFILLTLITLLIVTFSSEHFLQSHLWEHVIKKHFLSILLCTFSVLLIMHLLYYFVDINALIQGNSWARILILILAIAIGIIPESGPHLIFIVMFFSGTIPFSVLLSNSIVQEGHGALPLLADSRKSFILMKIIKIVIALIIGFSGLLIGF